MPTAGSAAPRGGRAGWFARWPALRDRLLASARFRRWAAGFPLTRAVAHRRAAALFDLVAGFVYSQVLLACVQLELFERLADGPLPLATLAPRLGLSEEAARRLLDAAVSLQLAEHRGAQGFGLGQLGATLVGDTAIAAMVRHHAALYADLADPVALLKADHGGSETALARYWPYAADASPRALTPNQVAAYSALMAASQALVADEILDAYAFGAHRCLLDVGGGEGVFLQHVAERAPHLQLMLFDLPAVAERARGRLATGPLRVQVFGGDFLREPLPEGADIATLVRVVHDHDDAGALNLLRAVRTALPPGGTVLLAEPMADTPGAQAMGNAYFGFYLLAMGRGRPRSRVQLAALLQQAGFDRVRALRTRLPLQAGVLLARVPGYGVTPT